MTKLIRMLRPAAWAGAVCLSAALAGPAAAGPPFITDDPEPTDFRHWEIYTFANGTDGAGETSGEAGLDLNYGAARDLQLTAVFPAAYDTLPRTSWGLGNIELAAKYRFAHQDGPLGVDLAVFPRAFLPTQFDRGQDRKPGLLLPLWAQKDFGKWSVYGGGGYTFNPGSGSRNFWQGGVVINRQVNERLMVGAEVFHQEPDTIGARPETFANFGGALKLVGHWSLIGTAGPGIHNARGQGQSVFYVALKADY
jgi:hypothetical protein